MGIDNTNIIFINFALAIVYAIVYSLDIISTIGIAFTIAITLAGTYILMTVERAPHYFVNFLIAVTGC